MSLTQIQVYLVGGAVRDAQLKLPIKDKDFLVTGATPDDMLAAGFSQVGADFPVFLHPHTHAEYALARLERKSGSGHTGFIMHTSPTVTVAEDLQRRDLTINALAMQVKGLFDDSVITGEVIDPYGGIADLNSRILRHVSPAFSEDPLRVLRVARFYARFYHLSFRIHPDTQALMQAISHSGELSHLSCERIWSETARALGEADGWGFFECLRRLNILADLLPELDALWADDIIYQSTQAKLKQAKHAALDSKFALLFSGFSASTDAALRLTFKRLNMPKTTARVICAFIDYQDKLYHTDTLSAVDWLTLIEATKAHKDDSLIHLLIDTIAIYQTDYDADNAKAKLASILAAYQAVTKADIDSSLKGKAIGDALSAKRIEMIGGVL